MDSRGKTNIEPIKLNERTLEDKETWEIQPYQYFWKRWFSSYDMPQLSLVMENGSLHVRSTRSLHSELIPLEEHQTSGIWNKKSIFVTDFPVGEFKRKLVVLDLKAQKTKTETGEEIIIKHARIRYPEVELEIKD